MRVVTGILVRILSGRIIHRIIARITVGIPTLEAIHRNVIVGSLPMRRGVTIHIRVGTLKDRRDKGLLAGSRGGTKVMGSDVGGDGGRSTEKRGMRSTTNGSFVDPSCQAMILN